MAIDNLLKLSGLIRPGYYGFPPGMAYGLPVSEKQDMHYADAMRTNAFLETLKRLDIIWNVSYKGRRTKDNDNELYYEIIIWEKLNVNS